jgi:hypothetical protein
LIDTQIEKVIALLSELVEYVTLTCNGDPARLVSSGFELNKERGTKAMSPIKELKVTIDHTGEAVTQVKKWQALKRTSISMQQTRSRATMYGLTRLPPIPVIPLLVLNRKRSTGSRW